MFRPMAPAAFHASHEQFQGDTWDVCEQCGGKCEINKIGSLMPGEAAFIAGHRGESEGGFRAAYLDGIATPHGVVDVLKLRPGCLFLDQQFRCTIREAKVVLCEVYPVIFEVKDDAVRFFNDPWCPIVRHFPQLSRTFEERGIPALRRLGTPIVWYRAVSLYDQLCVDYHKFAEHRGAEQGYRVFTMDEIRACQADDAPPPGLRPSRKSGASPIIRRSEELR